MSPSSRRSTLVKLLLTASLAHAPFPWLHDHAEMSPTERATHQITRHAGEASVAWHWHFTLLGRGGRSTCPDETPLPIGEDSFLAAGPVDALEFSSTLESTFARSPVDPSPALGRLFRHIHDAAVCGVGPPEPRAVSTNRLII